MESRLRGRLLGGLKAADGRNGHPHKPTLSPAKIDGFNKAFGRWVYRLNLVRFLKGLVVYEA
jgi:hypothetical protein